MSNNSSLRPPIIRKTKKIKSTLVGNLLAWNKENSQDYPWRRTTEPYKILVSELLLRKTRANKVSEIFPLFVQKFPTIFELAKSPLQKIRSTIYPLGRLERDKEIKSIATTIVEQYSGIIPNSEKELLEIVGPKSRYTVNAIRCFAFGENVPVFDVNVNRVLSRVFSINFGKQPHKNEEAWKFAKLLLPTRKVGEYNWALLDLGRTVCITKPRCSICPLLTICDYGRKTVVVAERQK